MSVYQQIGTKFDTLPNDFKSAKSNPIVIGIYGISGCGKTTLVNALKDKLGADFICYDGSTAIEIASTEDLVAFNLLNIDRKTYWRIQAIQRIRSACQKGNKVGVVAGHYMLWDDEEAEPQTVWTNGDKDTYTHILYLERPVEDIAQQRAEDKTRTRRSCSLDHLDIWQREEKEKLRQSCLEAGVLFCVLPTIAEEDLLCYTEKLICDFHQHTEESNERLACKKLDDALRSKIDSPETVILLDGDKTLIDEDTGKLFWNSCRTDAFGDCKDPLTAIFASRKEYNHNMFRQVMLLYEEIGNEAIFNDLCDKIAASIEIRPLFKSLIHAAAQQSHVGTVIVTVGLSRIFIKLVEREGLGSSVTVIGSGRVDNGFVVTGQVKGSLARHIRRSFGCYIFAFGDSQLDISMLAEADEAIVVVNDDKIRSKSMEPRLYNQIEQGWPSSSKLYQLLISDTAQPLSQFKCPYFGLSQRHLGRIFRRPSSRPVTPKVIEATSKNAAKILMTPMRDANVRGPALRSAHQSVGRYLATEYVTEVVGIEKYSVPHVQGTTTDGYQLRGEKHTLIIALMRGGEPMALGVNEAFPTATFLHAKVPSDLKEEVVRGVRTIILVDSVINNGKSMWEFVIHIRSLHPKIHIVMVAGVVQKDSISTSDLADYLATDLNTNLVALRLSENKYSGKGGTDTGNRLFNTTHL